MNENCRHEVHVRRAATEDKWSESLRAHIETCADCRAAAAIAPFMSRLSRVEERRPVLPPASVVWLKAQLMRGTAVAERVTRPLNVMQIAAYLSVAAAWAGMLFWKWPDLQRMVVAFRPEQMSYGSPVSMTLVASFVFLGAVTCMVAMHTILAEE